MKIYNCTCTELKKLGLPVSHNKKSKCMIDILTKKLAVEMSNKMDIDYWIRLQTIDKCFYGCKKFKEPLYIENNKFIGAKILNPKYIFHLESTHGFSREIFIEEIANNLYKNQEDRDKMMKIYVQM